MALAESFIENQAADLGADQIKEELGDKSVEEFNVPEESDVKVIEKLKAIKQLAETTPAPTIHIDDKFGKNPLNVMEQLSQNLYSQLFTGTVRTLPMFHISKTSDLFQFAILLSQEPGFIQTLKPKAKAYLDKVISGALRS